MTDASDRNLAALMDTVALRAFFTGLQQRIVGALERIDGGAFRRDEWSRTEGGGGISRLIEDGAVLVMHPRNPYAPTVHMNVRFFVARKEGSAAVWWFGGGMDLTPYYGFAEDAVHFHRVCRDALLPFGAELYPRYKHWCDDYFYLKHRREPRGLGGIFFDDLADGGFDRCAALTKSVGEHFIAAYAPILERRKDMRFGERERDFQAYRRGRYVEFNLVWDRGTLFGLQSSGRTEAILLSLPPLVKWRYDWHPDPGTPEASLYSDFLVAKDWLG